MVILLRCSRRGGCCLVSSDQKEWGSSVLAECDWLATSYSAARAIDARPDLGLATGSCSLHPPFGCSVLLARHHRQTSFSCCRESARLCTISTLLHSNEIASATASPSALPQTRPLPLFAAEIANPF